MIAPLVSNVNRRRAMPGLGRPAPRQLPAIDGPNELLDQGDAARHLRRTGFRHRVVRGVDDRQDPRPAARLRLRDADAQHAVDVGHVDQRDAERLDARSIIDR